MKTDDLERRIFEYEQFMSPINGEPRVYIARCCTSGDIKVGATRNHIQRRRLLRAERGEPVEYILLFPHDRRAFKLEATIHRTLHSLGYEHKGEWYSNITYKEALNIIQEVIVKHLEEI